MLIKLNLMDPVIKTPDDYFTTNIFEKKNSKLGLEKH